jgi:hypothetical protein
VKRSLILIAALALASAALAQAADVVSLAASSPLVCFDGQVTLAGTVTPAIPGEPVTILQGSTPVWNGATAVDGSFGTTVAVQRAGSFVAVAGGIHIEVYKGRQVAFEVRYGRVVGITHRKVTGWDWLLWYPLYLHGGFALHGYPSAPAYPASNGFVRLPMWFARGLNARWPYGATVRSFP